MAQAEASLGEPRVQLTKSEMWRKLCQAGNSLSTGDKAKKTLEIELPLRVTSDMSSTSCVSRANLEAHEASTKRDQQSIFT